MTRTMGSFGENVHNSGNVGNVPVYVINPCPAYIFQEDAPLGGTPEKSTFVNNLGKIRSV